MRLNCLFTCVICIHTLFASTHNPPQITQHHQQVLGNKSATLSEQMINILHRPTMETPFLDEDNLDLNFISNMIPHNQGIIAASEFMLKHSTNYKIRNIAQKAISTQKTQISQYEAMLPILQEQKKLYSPKEVTLFNQQAKEDLESMNKALSEITADTSLNKSFLLSMIMYSQKSITASKQILQYTQNEEIKAIAQDIINEKEVEIEAFHTILKTIH